MYHSLFGHINKLRTVIWEGNCPSRLQCIVARIALVAVDTVDRIRSIHMQTPSEEYCRTQLFNKRDPINYKAVNMIDPPPSPPRLLK